MTDRTRRESDLDAPPDCNVRTSIPRYSRHSSGLLHNTGGPTPLKHSLAMRAGHGYELAQFGSTTSYQGQTHGQ